MKQNVINGKLFPALSLINDELRVGVAVNPHRPINSASININFIDTTITSSRLFFRTIIKAINLNPPVNAGVCISFSSPDPISKFINQTNSKLKNVFVVLTFALTIHGKLYFLSSFHFIRLLNAHVHQIEHTFFFPSRNGLSKQTKGIEEQEK